MYHLLRTLCSSFNTISRSDSDTRAKLEVQDTCNTDKIVNKCEKVVVANGRKYHTSLLWLLITYFITQLCEATNFYGGDSLRAAFIKLNMLGKAFVT